MFFSKASPFHFMGMGKHLKIVKALYFFGIHLLLVVVLWKSDFLTQVGYRLGVISPWIHHERMLNYHRWMDPQVPEGSVLFIGDSHIQGLAVSAVTDNSINYGIGGDTTSTVLRRIDVYESIQRVSAIVLLVGVNDVRWRSNEVILKDYKLILERLAEANSIIIVSIFPVGSGIGRMPTDETNRRIRELNQGLLELAQANEDVNYLDLYTVMSDEDGSLKKYFDAGDGLHLSIRGYNVLIQALKSGLDHHARERNN
ncbi:MAG: GDSL-type esterase/lipase family protein [Verrucomicrobiota bacterium]